MPRKYETRRRELKKQQAIFAGKNLDKNIHEGKVIMVPHPTLPHTMIAKEVG